MAYKTQKSLFKILNISFFALALMVLMITLSPFVSAQNILPSRSLKISNSLAGSTNVNYIVSFSAHDPLADVGSLRLRFCENSPIVVLPCDQISGFNIQNVTIANQAGPGDFSVYFNNNSNEIIFNRPSSPLGNTPVSITLSGVSNPANKGTYYGRLELFNSQDATGYSISSGGVVFSITEPVAINTEVPPFLYLCVGVIVPGFECLGAVDSFVDLGELSSNRTSAGSSQFIVATNAGSGFNVAVSGLPPTSGNNVINPLLNRQFSRVGVSQFGINLKDNNIPDVGSEPAGVGSGIISEDYSIANQFKFNSGDYIVYSNSPTLDKKYTVSYIVNVSQDQRPGIYSGTYLYTAVASF